MKPWEEIASFGEGAYAGFISTSTEQDTLSLYPKETYEKLAQIKAKYDPDNLFKMNFNIKPAV
jgi:FAD/FMN-containing dehydrogenase